MLSRVQLFATWWTVACQVPLSWDFQSKYTRVGFHFLLQGIFPTQASNPSLLWFLQRQIDFFFPQLSHLGSLLPLWSRRNCIRMWYHQSPETRATGGLWARVGATIYKSWASWRKLSHRRGTSLRTQQEKKQLIPLLPLPYNYLLASPTGWTYLETSFPVIQSRARKNG